MTRRKSNVRASERLEPRAKLNVERLEDRLTPTMTSFLDASGVTFTGDAADNTLTLTQSLDGYLQHNLSIAGNLVSARDLDSTQPGEQTRPLTQLVGITVLGGTGNDTIDGSAVAYTINMTVFGGAGGDTLLGGAGGDDVRGDDGDDVLDGGGGDDTLRGDGNANFAPSTGSDTLRGGAGRG